MIILNLAIWFDPVMWLTVPIWSVQNSLVVVLIDTVAKMRHLSDFRKLITRDRAMRN